MRTLSIAMSETLFGNAPNTRSERDYALLREGCGKIATLPLALIKVEGEDRKAWLQGQITNDMRSLHDGGSLSACLCSATGQLLAILKIWSLGPAYYIAAHRDAMTALITRLDQLVILEDVRYERLSWQCLSVQGPEATQTLGDLMSLPTMDVGFTKIGKVESLALRADHSGMGGWDFWVEPGVTQSLEKTLAAIENVAEETLAIAQLEAGIPRFGIDTNEKTLPPELGASFESRTISYTKGCYTGQEVLMRIHSRGHTNKTWVGLFTDEMVPVGASIEAKGKPEQGTITSAFDSPRYGTIAGAWLRNEHAADGDLVAVQTPAGPVAAEVRLMPILRFD
jgi:folate-binding protein YgfZ